MLHILTFCHFFRVLHVMYVYDSFALMFMIVIVIVVIRRYDSRPFLSVREDDDQSTP